MTILVLISLEVTVPQPSRDEISPAVQLPPIDHVEQRWWPEAGRFTDYSLVPNIGEPYRAAMPPHIAGLDLSIPSSLARELETATLQLRSFDAEFGADVLPYVTLLVRSEALSSSQIEHVNANARQVIAAEIGEFDRASATLIASAGSSLAAALEDPGEVNAQLASRIHAALLEGHTHLTPGQWRSDPIWIGTSSASPHGADYVAPPADSVPDLMADWSTFAARTDLPILAHVMIAHAQFETIHPFRDGNGRTGRALLQAMLRRHAVTTRLLVPVSAGLLHDTDSYFAALAAYQAGDAAPILRAGVEAIDRSVGNARQLVNEIREIRMHLRDSLRIRPQSRAWEVIDFMFEQPVFTARVAAERLDITVNNMQRHLDRLLDEGVLRQSASAHRGRGRVYRSPDVLAALDRFAARSA